MGTLNDEQLAAVEALTRGLVNKFLHPPMQALKQAAREGDSARLDRAVRNLVGLCRSPRRNRRKQSPKPQAPNPGRKNHVPEHTYGGAPMNLRIGSRGSQLALWQANHIADLLRSQGHTVEIEIIKTTGDRLQEITFAQVGSKGMFTKEIEEALASGRVHLAVHSLKDLPTDLPEQFALAAVPPRVDPRDAFVSVKYMSLASLPQGAQRRHQQLSAVARNSKRCGPTLKPSSSAATLTPAPAQAG